LLRNCKNEKQYANKVRGGIENGFEFPSERSLTTILNFQLFSLVAKSNPSES
jgi:hypothetical protein